LSAIQNGLADIEHHMLHLNNHDEQRLASPNLQERHKRKPLMVVSTTISTSPNGIFGQEVGEAGNENAGFGTLQNINL
jgi:hypothetical protein